MNLLTQRPLRLFCDLASPNQALEKITSQPPVIMRGSPTVFQLGIGRNRALFAEIASDIASLTVQVRATSDPSSAVLMEQSISAGFNDTLTEANWNSGEDEHAEIAFTDAEANQTPGDYWLAIWFDDLAGNSVPLCFGKITVKESGAGTNGVPPDPVDQYYTKTEIDVLFAAMAIASDAVRISNGFLQLKDQASGNWRSVWLNAGALQVGPEVAP